LNPEFSIKLPITGKNKITVRAEDQYGNGTDAVYALFRKSEPVAVVKPVTTDVPKAHREARGQAGGQACQRWCDRRHLGHFHREHPVQEFPHR
jgi:hypothetical protein